MKRIIAVLTLTALIICLTACAKGGSNVKSITSFDTVTLTITGSRAWQDEYEFVRSDDGFTLSHYSGYWKYDENLSREDCLEKRITGGADEYQQLLELFNSCKIMKWDGFSKSDKRALDGYMFTFSAFVNDGVKLYARGSNAYPKNYGEFLSAVKEMLGE